MLSAKKLLMAGAPKTRVTGQAAYTSPGTFQWTCPQGVFEVAVVCVGGGSRSVGAGTAVKGGAGGGLGWKNKIKVRPGVTYTVFVGRGASNENTLEVGENSYFKDTATVMGRGGATEGSGRGGGFVGDGGGRGGNSLNISQGGEVGGGGAAGYTGNGGDGADYNNDQGFGANRLGLPGQGGGAAGGNPTYHGGGVGLLGQGANGQPATSTNQNGGGGSGGTSGSGGTNENPSAAGVHGGGATSRGASIAGGGAVRIIYGPNRAFPATNTGNL